MGAGARDNNPFVTFYPFKCARALVGSPPVQHVTYTTLRHLILGQPITSRLESERVRT